MADCIYPEPFPIIPPVDPTPGGGDCDCAPLIADLESRIAENYYTKEQTDALINAIDTGEFVIVDELPESGDPKNIYLVPKTTGYVEWLYINGAWEEIGDTDIDLSDYYTMEQVDQLLDGYPTTSAMEARLDEKQDVLEAGANISIEDNTISAVGVATSTELAAVDTKADNALSVAQGKQDPVSSGTNIDITNNVISAPNVYSKTEVNEIIDAIETGEVQIVQELPESGANKVIYFLPRSGGGYTEWMYINDGWEEIGDTDIDLSDYYTKSQIDALLAEKQDVLTKDDLLQLLGYSDQTITKTDSSGKTVTIHVLGYIEAPIRITIFNGTPVSEDRPQGSDEYFYNTAPMEGVKAASFDQTVYLTITNFVLNGESIGDVELTSTIGANDEWSECYFQPDEINSITFYINGGTEQPMTSLSAMWLSEDSVSISWDSMKLELEV